MDRKEPTIEIFRAGRHTAMDGTTLEFSEADIANMASAYDPKVFDAPAVVGHPEHDKPAYAWASALTADKGVLCASLGDIDPAFAEIVKAKRFKKISAAFYAPNAPSNPKPGVYYLRHIGFLGAMAPAVKGLKSAEFASDEKGILEFGDLNMPWVFSTIARMFRGLRDSIIADKGLEAANTIIQDWDINSVEDAAARAQALTSPVYSEQQPVEKTNLDKTLEERKGALDTRDADITKRDVELKARETAFAESEKKRRGNEDEALIDGLVKAGKFAPGHKKATLAFMAQLGDAAADALQFAETGDKQTPRAFFSDLLKQSGKLVEFGEVSKPGSEAEKLSDDPAQAGIAIARAATAYMEEQRKAGNVITIGDAVRHVEQKQEKTF